LEECLDGENPFVAGTYSKVLETIATPVKKKANIKYGSRVMKIRGRTITDDQVTATTKDGTVYNFDELVVTLPLGFLKAHLNIFEPPVPNRFSEAVESLGYGHLDKVGCSRLLDFRY
jgi:monoamine oxidase